mgnify:CR=1 FL=1
MSLLSMLLAIACIIGFFAAILYVVFGQITVRKLRKKAETKDKLGFEYASGWDIINVAQALSLPRSWCQKLENSPLGSMYANSNLLFEHTNRFDQVLAVLFYWLFTISGLMMISLAILETCGFFEA